MSWYKWDLYQIFSNSGYLLVETAHYNASANNKPSDPTGTTFLPQDPKYKITLSGQEIQIPSNDHKLEKLVAKIQNSETAAEYDLEDGILLGSVVWWPLLTDCVDMNQ